MYRNANSQSTTHERSQIIIANNVLRRGVYYSTQVSTVNATCRQFEYTPRAGSVELRFMPLLLGVRLAADDSSCPIVDTEQYMTADACGSGLDALLQQVEGAAAPVQCYGPSETLIAERVACTISPKPSQRDPRFAIGVILVVASLFILLAACGAGACVACGAV